MGNCMDQLSAGAKNKNTNQGNTPAKLNNQAEKETVNKENNNNIKKEEIQQNNKGPVNGSGAVNAISGGGSMGKPTSFQNKKKDLSNYQFMNENDKFLSKQPGTLNGQMFRIQGCNDCNIYVHDSHNQCFIDDCKNCVIVMGPCSSSTFIRDCVDCKVLITCQQLRMRDCKNIDLMLYTQTEPIIESSSRIRFVCHQYSYPEMFEHMRAAKLSFWNNKWTNVFDFTPSKGSGLNYSINDEINQNFVTNLKQMESIISQIEKLNGKKILSLKDIEDADLEQIEIDFGFDSTLCIPFQLGKNEWKSTNCCFIILFVDSFDDVYNKESLEFTQTLYDQFLSREAFWIKESRSTDIDKKQIIELLQQTTIGIEMHANNYKEGFYENFESKIDQILGQMAKKLLLSYSCDKQVVSKQAQLIFRTFNVEHTGHNIAQ